MPACVDQELLLGGLVDGELDAANTAMVEAHAGRDAVLEVEDDGVGVALKRLGDLPFAVRRNEQPGPGLAHCAFFCRSAVRVHSQTSSPRWLKLRCAQVTIPALGRDLLSRTARHSLSLRSVSPANTGLGKTSLS